MKARESFPVEITYTLHIFYHISIPLPYLTISNEGGFKLYGHVFSLSYTLKSTINTLNMHPG